MILRWLRWRISHSSAYRRTARHFICSFPPAFFKFMLKPVQTHLVLNQPPLPFAWRRALCYGLAFAPSPPPCSRTTLLTALRKFDLSCTRNAFFASAHKSQSTFNPTRCKIPSSWSPTPNQLGETDLGRKTLHALYLFRKLILDRFDLPIPPHLRTHRNLSASCRHALKDMLASHQYVVSPSDKNIGPAVASSDNYTTFSLSCFQEGWRELSRADAAHIHTNFCNTALSLLSSFASFAGFVDKTTTPPWFVFLKTHLQRHLMTDKTRFAPFYTLWKVHKTPIACRPIVPMTSHFTREVSIWLHEQLLPIVHCLPTVLSSSRTLLLDLHTLSGHLPASAVLSVRDVVSLYPSIPTSHGIFAVSWALDRLSSHSRQFKQLIIDLLTLVMSSVTVTFHNRFFLQTDGTAMGSPVAVVFANIFMFWVEHSLVDTFLQSGRLRLYCRYIDDIFALFQDHASAEAFWPLFLAQHPKHAAAAHLPAAKWIDLTGPIATRRASCLDLNIELIPRGPTTVIATQLFQKHLNRFMYLPFSSAQPVSVKRAFLREELRRALVAFSSEDDFTEYKLAFFHRLRARGFPSSFILRSWSDISYAQRSTLLEAARRNLAKTRAAAASGQPTSRTNKSVNPLILPFDARTESLNINTIFRSAFNAFTPADFKLFGKPFVSWTKVSSLGRILQSANRKRFNAA